MNQHSARSLQFLRPDFGQHRRVCVAVSTNIGGVSTTPYDCLNLAVHTGDDPISVMTNRQLVSDALELPPVQWLTQTHGENCIRAGVTTVAEAPIADAAFTDSSSVAVAVLTADCLPVVLADRSGGWVAVVHCGWRGLLNSVLANTLAATPVGECDAWLGPCIGAARYEVGEDVAGVVRDLVGGSVDNDPLQPGQSAGKSLLDLKCLARYVLGKLGVNNIRDGGICVFDDPRFYSHRRASRQGTQAAGAEATTGRFATLAWLSEA